MTQRARKFNEWQTDLEFEFGMSPEEAEKTVKIARRLFAEHNGPQDVDGEWLKSGYELQRQWFRAAQAERAIDAKHEANRETIQFSEFEIAEAAAVTRATRGTEAEMRAGQGALIAFYESGGDGLSYKMARSAAVAKAREQIKKLGAGDLGTPREATEKLPKNLRRALKEKAQAGEVELPPKKLPTKADLAKPGGVPKKANPFTMPQDTAEQRAAKQKMVLDLIKSDAGLATRLARAAGTTLDAAWRE